MNGKFIQSIGYITEKRNIGVQMNERAPVNDIGPPCQRFYCIGKLVATNTGQKTESPEIDSHNRDILVPDQRHGIQQRSVASQADQKINIFFELLVAGERFRR